MSNFNNSGLGDGGLQRSREKLSKYGLTEEKLARTKAKFDEHHIDIAAKWDSVPDHLRRPEHRRDYKQLTYEELKAKIEDALYNPQPLTSSEEQEAEESWKKFELAHPLADAPEGWEETHRAELMEIIEPGMYDISVPGMSVWTGKGGYIDYLIALEKSAKHYK